MSKHSTITQNYQEGSNEEIVDVRALTKTNDVSQSSDSLIHLDLAY